MAATSSKASRFIAFPSHLRRLAQLALSHAASLLTLPFTSMSRGQGVARQILEHLALPTTGPPTAKAARMGGDEREPAPEYDQVDPTWDE